MTPAQIAELNHQPGVNESTPPEHFGDIKDRVVEGETLFFIAWTTKCVLIPPWQPLW